MSGTKKISCPRNKNIIVWERREMREERKKAYCDHVREKWETKLVRELVSEYYSSKLLSILTYQNFLVKVMRLLGVFFSVFIKLAHKNNFLAIFVRLLWMFFSSLNKFY
jgi:hypothetical protein